MSSAPAIAPQPFGSPMVITTPHTRAEVLGTRLAIEVTRTSTRIEVRAGLVRFTRLSDGSSIDVAEGYAAVVAPGDHLIARPIPADR